MTRRLRSCVEEWPDAETGAYHPRCCRFPKSCSATVYSDSTPDEDLEPAGENRCRGDRDCPAEEHIEGCFASAAPETYTWQVHDVPVPVTADAHRAIAVEVQHAMVMSSAVYHEGIIARAVADAEKRAAARALRDAARDVSAAYARMLTARADALDPS